jgi:TPR repeat protein/pSer/pThr/pTyr-binding forkhead associated (FHA) protein
MSKSKAHLLANNVAHDLHEDTTTVGRATDNMIVLDDESVSSHHAEIFIREDLVYLRDIGSTNGTKVNGQSVTEIELENGDVVCFGTADATFTVASQSSAEVRLPNEIQTHASGASDALKESSLRSLGSKLASQGKAAWNAARENAAVASKETQTKLVHFGKTAWQEAKRNSQLLSLKAQIEKLTRLDLRQAFHDLGLKCYELKACEGKLAPHYLIIANLEQQIVEKRKGMEASAEVKSIDKLLAVAGNQAKKVGAQALTIKMGGLLLALGKEALVTNDVSLPEQELRHVRDVETHIEKLEDAYRMTAAQTSGESKQSTPRMLEWSIGAVALSVALVVAVPMILHKDKKMNAENLATRARLAGESKAITYLRDKAEVGDAKAQCCLGAWYFDGYGLPKDEKRAFELFSKAAAQKFPVAQSNVGVCFFLGAGVPQDAEQAVKWFRLAAEQHYAKGQLNLAMCLDRGDGAVQNQVEAVKWYEKAAEQGLKSAMSLLSFCYSEGKGVAKDEVQARYWILQSSAGEDRFLSRHFYAYERDSRETVDSAMSPLEVDQAVAAMDVDRFERYQENDKWGFKKIDGPAAMPPQFDYATDFVSDAAFVCKDGGYGFISPDGKFLGKEREGLVPQIDSSVVLRVLQGYADIPDSIIAKMGKNIPYSSALLEFVKAGYNFKDVEVEMVD